MDRRGIRDPRQIAEILPVREGYAKQVRHTLIQDGRIAPLERTNNFSQKHAQQRQSAELIDTLIKQNLSDVDICTQADCSLFTVKRHRRLLNGSSRQVA